MSIVTSTIFGYFKAAGVFRKRSDETARIAFDDAFSDFLEDGSYSEAEIASFGSAGDALFAALMERRDNDKAAKAADIIAREERRAAKEAAEKAKPITGGMDGSRDHVRALPAGRYVLTSAQNNTDVDATFMAALHEYCKRHNAQLLIGRMTYNKAAFQQPDVNDTDGIYYADAVKPYLVNGTLDLGGKFYFLADANVIPTAKWPTSGFDAASPVGVGAIVPATRIELRTAAALKGDVSKPIMATGTVTKRNYILRKTGAIAASGHNIGALFVDTETNTFRHLEQMEGYDGFFDIDGHYTGDGFRPLRKGDVAAYQPGDIHAEKADDANVVAICDNIRRFQPENVLVHDLLDFSSRNHHNIKDPFFLHAQYTNEQTVEGDLQIASDTLDAIAEANRNAKVRVIVSNHDQAADKWLATVDWRNDPINAEVYLKLALAKVQNVNNERFNTLEYAYRTIGKGISTNVIFHVLDESVMIAGVQMGCHGHNGANGSKGSPKQFSALGVAINTGHTHSPSIYGACYTAGVRASLDMGYNVGASSWAVADTLTYANGQRQILFA